MSRKQDERWVVGINAVASVLENDAVNVRELRVDARARNPRVQELAEQARSHGIAVQRVAADSLDRLSDGLRHQGVVADYAAVNALDESDLPELLERSEKPLVLVLDGVTDPHNLGACLRVADGAGAHAVIAPKDHAVGINATVAKVASGAAETMPYFMVTNLARTLNELKERNIWVIGTSDDAPKTLYEVDLKGPVALVLGAEGLGMRQLTRKTCDELVGIPMKGAVESLNVSVASGVCLYEALRQRG
ncbi:MAG: 23S rRNA (guanosine(2251)-2'-O)-methyltransferase RlmB [Xanthomonadales bacterium]|nr:23S rRNA (guanosine(2251)-2'-O)-methyltransferase RlmB [Xanthomonadales bacterium]